MKTEYTEIRMFLKENQFFKTDFHSSDSFGDFYEIWQSDKMKIRLSQTKNIPSIEISPVFDGHWRDLPLHRVLILKKSDELTKVLDFDEMQEFILNHYDDLMKLYEPKNVTTTLRSLADLGMKRAKLLFPSQFI